MTTANGYGYLALFWRLLRLARPYWLLAATCRQRCQAAVRLSSGGAFAVMADGARLRCLQVLYVNSDYASIASPIPRASMTAFNDATPAGSAAICAVDSAEEWKEIS